MFLLAHRWLRGSILGLMFFLAGTACCWSDSYDPDPYDDSPPVVTVEFDYVVPSHVSVRIPKIQASASRHLATQADRLPDFALRPGLTGRSSAQAFQPSLPKFVIPLRR